jgi:glucose dehydrogenase
MTSTSGRDSKTETKQRLARYVLVAFLATFIAARVVVFLIMSRTIPDLFLHVGGTHVHHLNYGIFLLAGVGAYLVFQHPVDRRLRVAATLYGVGLALTFDEFGMWLHLGGGYWQRASFDAVVVIAAALGLIMVAPSIKRFRPRHWATAAVLTLALVTFGVLLVRSFHYAERTIGPKLKQLDAVAPP